MLADDVVHQSLQLHLGDDFRVEDVDALDELVVRVAVLEARLHLLEKRQLLGQALGSLALLLRGRQRGLQLVVLPLALVRAAGRKRALTAGLGTFLSSAGRGEVGQEVGELFQEVVVRLEQRRHLFVHLRDALQVLAIHVEDLEERLVHSLVVGESRLDLVHVGDGVDKLHLGLRGGTARRRLGALSLLALLALNVLDTDLVTLDWKTRRGRATSVEVRGIVRASRGRNNRRARRRLQKKKTRGVSQQAKKEGE